MRELIWAAALAVTGTATVRAQNLPQPHAEYRIDYINGRGNTLQGGAGWSMPVGIYVRMALDGAAGTTWRDGVAHASGRVDGIARFTLDPLRESPIGFSLGGGLSVPVIDGERVRPYATVVMDIEGRRRGNWTPAVQIGLGGGARVGVVIRGSDPHWR
ncbi:MAG TPA: hypothetical protein VN706_02220 [Gemmatimonadaceae bacterium]|nr:hypothetical protein [Gemmatimonadaceae bacterium]